MSLFNCSCKCNCTTAAVVAGAVIGVFTAFFQITGVITLAPVFLWVALGIAVIYLSILLLSAALASRREGCCATLTTVLTGILGTLFFALILLAVGIVATSVFSAILVGLLLFFLTLTFGGTACLVRCLLSCGE